MKQFLQFLLLCISLSASSQSLIQSINSGSIIASNTMVSIGEIVVVPQNTAQSSSGMIGILAQNQQNLEVTELELSTKITVFPNPTTSGIRFQTDLSLQNEKVLIYSISGQLVSEKRVSEDNSLSLDELATGIYMIQFANQNVKAFKIIKH
jgi:Secretion system C-terminal sorting domain